MAGGSKGRKGGKGGGGGGGGGGGAALPDGVKVEDDGEDKDYVFKVSGKEVTFTVEKRSADRVSVSFDVAGSLNRGNLQGRDAVKAAMTIKRIFEHDVSTRPDGFKYQASASRMDGYGARRAAAYQKAGFSAPPGGEPGLTQRGIVKNGKLVPDNSHL